MDDKSQHSSGFYRIRGKRIFDLAMLALAFPVVVPVVAMLALMVRIGLGSPVLFKQERLGLNGRAFFVKKFRTMTGARDSQGNLLPDRERLTRLGRLLRATSLDELPELINVLRGEMSIVGPRPLYAHYRDRYTPEQFRRHEALPGITGWAQINGRNALGWEQKFEMDVWYADHQSFWLDAKIIALTFLRVIKREGISQPGHATAEEFKGKGA